MWTTLFATLPEETGAARMVAFRAGPTASAVTRSASPIARAFVRALAFRLAFVAPIADRAFAFAFDSCDRNHVR